MKPFPAAFFLAIILAPTVRAHRLEGLLQASLVEVLPTQAAVEVTLSPGVDVAPTLIGLIDTNGDGNFSADETKEWSALFLAQQSVTVDGKSLTFKLDGMRTSSLTEMNDGHAEIAVHFTAELGELSTGPRTIVCANRYQPIHSSYQTNGLVPKAPNVHISNHRRDAAQQELTLSVEFSEAPAVTPPTAPSPNPVPQPQPADRLWWLLGNGLIGAALAVCCGRRCRSSKKRACATNAPAHKNAIH